MGLVDCLYLEKGKRKPVKDFIDSLHYKTQRKFFAKKELLEAYGHLLPKPHAKYLGGSIFELRFRGVEGEIRILYFFLSKTTAVFTNAFIKKTKKTPKNKIAIAARDRKLILDPQVKKK